MFRGCINNAQIIGTLKETNMEIVTKEVTLKGSNGVEKKVTCKQIAKKSFGNPMFVIECNGNDVGVDYFPVAEKKLEKDTNNIIDNPRYKALETVMSTYVTMAQDKDNATRVKIDGVLRENVYPATGTYEIKSFPQINGFQITSSNVPSEDSTDSEISGIIRSIAHETRGENADETGRLIVELYSIDSLGVLSIFKFIVDSDIANDFENYYNVGDSTKIYYEISTRQVGSPKSSSGGFGRRDSNRVTGYSVTEYSIFRGDDPFEEENDYYISNEVVKQAMDEREIKLENMVKDAKERNSSATPSSNPKGSASKATATKANPFGGGSTTTTTPKKNPFA